MTWAFSGLSGGCAATSWPLVSVVTSVHSLGGVRAVIIVRGGVVRRPDPEEALRLGDDLGDAERLAAHLVIADGVDEVARPDEQEQLPEVDLRDEHRAIAPEDRL